MILPSLRSGKVVVLDRYYFSNAAYQGARGIDFQSIIDRNEQFAPEPDLLVLIDIDPAIGIRRVVARDFEANEFERIDGLEAARAHFQRIDTPYTFRIDGSDSPDALAERIRNETLRRYCHAIALDQSADSRTKLTRILNLGGAMSGTVPAPL